MKILIIQLARLGDILMTWPQVRALRKEFPNAQIDLLVRPKFKAAVQGLTQINHVHEFPIEALFEPLFHEPLKIDESLSILDQTITSMKAENYDWIINSTLSPASSYLTSEIKTESTKISGYSRTSDGYLAIHDDVSSYIYAQVGIDRNNRIHLADLFILMVGLQPKPEDWYTEVLESSPVSFENYIVLHVGASRDDKKYSPFKWRTFITHFQKLCDSPIVLIGANEESKEANFIALGFDSTKVLDLTGKLEFNKLFPLIKNTKLYVGCDSAPLHIASLVGTPALNISFSSVNFWETGPKSQGSRVLYAETEADLPSEKVAQEALNILNQNSPLAESIYTINDTPSFHAPENTHGNDWTWNLIKSIYMDGELPDFSNSTRRQGLKNLYDVNLVILEQLETIKKTGHISLVSGIIERCEEVIETVGKLVPELSPLIRWYQTQKTRIGPDAPHLVLQETMTVHREFDHIMEYWLSDHTKKGETHESSQS